MLLAFSVVDDVADRDCYCQVAEVACWSERRSRLSMCRQSGWVSIDLDRSNGVPVTQNMLSLDAKCWRS